MTVLEPTNEDEVLDAVPVADDDTRRAPRPGDMVSPTEFDGPIEIRGWAIKIRNFRGNLCIAFGDLSKIQKTMLTLGTGTTGGVIGWLTGTWHPLVGFYITMFIGG